MSAEAAALMVFASGSPAGRPASAVAGGRGHNLDGVADRAQW